MAKETATCPFCSITSASELAIQLHIEESHYETASQETSDDGRHGSAHPTPQDDKIETPSESNEWTKCTRAECGDYIHLSEIDQHIAFHESIESEELVSQLPSTQQNSSGMAGQSSTSSRTENRVDVIQRSSTSNSVQRNIFDYFYGTSSPRRPRRRLIRHPREPGMLGRRELGPHAYEGEMPAQVRRHLLHDAEPREIRRIGSRGQLVRETRIENETSNVVPVLADLCALDPTTSATYFCDSNVKHVCKIRCDGNFCGYWNIQMLISYLQLTNKLPDMPTMPNVLQMQDTIEAAWSNDICIYGKTQTGGIRGTRKWIGTPEVVAYFTQVGIRVNTLSFGGQDGANEDVAVEAMLDHVEAYFLSGSENTQSHGTSHVTRMPPIYFQRFGHSMTIVGLERKRDGGRNLLVFDPSCSTSPGVQRLADGNSTRANTGTLLTPYRRSDLALARWTEFEIVV